MAKTYTQATQDVNKKYDAAYEQGLVDKFNAATAAQYNLQREQNRQAENAYYNQMYNTQKTAMDTIRQNNAAAVATGASRGVQAANELSAILGLQQESVAGATEVAQARRQTAQEETAAVLENVLKAYQQAETARQSELTAAIQGASVDAENAAALMSMMEQAKASQHYEDANAYAEELRELGYDIPEITVPDTDDAVNGNLSFTPDEIRDANIANVYNKLDKAKIPYNNQAIFDLSDTSKYGVIDQADVSADGVSGEAGQYINALLDAANGKLIKVGQVVQFNYGAGSAGGSRNYSYVYLGGTKFAKIKTTGSDWINSDKASIYVPTGYTARVRADGSIRVKKSSDED